MNEVILDYVTFRYGPVIAADNVTLHANGGEFFALLGPRGSAPPPTVTYAYFTIHNSLFTIHHLFCGQIPLLLQFVIIHHTNREVNPMSILDAHIHYGDDAPALLALLAEFDLKLLNISLAQDNHGAWRAENSERYCALAHAHPQRFAWCTSFDLPRFDDPHYVDSVIAGLDADFAAGAVACKIWKNIGMEVRTPSGEFFLPNDACFDPIYEHLAAQGKPLLTHIAEPLACWQPLQEGSPHYNYYSRNPQWHMYGRSDYPSHEQLMAARDNVLAKHPTLRMIGAHFASLEWDVDVLAARLDRYPNLAVDISARLVNLAIQESAKVRDFFLRYSDRILFGTDVVMKERPSTMAAAEQAATIQALREVYEQHFAYFETDQEVTVRGFATRGIKLPPAVLEQFYRLNAQEWYPGV